MKLTYDDQLAFRQTLAAGKKHSIFRHIRLAHAADKNLRRLNQELKDYESRRDELIEEYAERDDEGRKTHVVQPEGTRIVRDDDEDVFRYAEDGDDHNAGDRYAPVREVSRIWDRVGTEIADTEAFEEELQMLKDEEVDITVHQVEADLLWEHAELPSGAHQHMDLAALDPMLKEV